MRKSSLAFAHCRRHDPCRLYSEKAYVLSRGFVRRALEYPVSGLESELEFFYHGDGSAKYPGRLPRVLERANALITHSEQTRAGDKKDNAQEDSASTAQADESSGDASASGSGAAKKREEEVAVSRLSGGGVIVLKRTLAALEKLRAQRAAAPKAA